jgi:DNA-directed RNA polymerase specialized sigma24 family protein
MTQPDDEHALAESFAASDDRALGLVYARWSPLIYTFALRSLGHVADAEDATRRIFFAAWNERGTFNPARSLPRWLVGIAETTLADAPNIESSLGDRLLVGDAIAELEPDSRRVIGLAFSETLSHGQIADRLGLTPATVRADLRESLERISSRLEVPHVAR